ncbi:hypothetical protein ACI2J9_21615 [Pseudomonas fulva]|uniref:hypothetical protein n=1 Tax=Pseudomonas fulva TaxID=47880 RepID=UPI003850A82C
MNEARQAGPYKVLRSFKTDAALAKCVQYEWQNQPIFLVEHLAPRFKQAAMSAIPSSRKHQSIS